MIKNKFFLFLLLVIIFIISFDTVPQFKERVLYFANNIKTAFLKEKENLINVINIHFQQANTIKELKKEIEYLKPNAIMAISYQKELEKLLKETNLNYHHPSLFLVRTLSYEKISNYTRLWVDFKNFDKNKIYGLIYKGYVAGIIKEKYGNPLAYLELDPSVALSVYVGDFKAQGVIFGNDSNMIVKYIQKYNTIKIGDEVETSGKDGIFPIGIKIGKVINIKEKELYNEATVKPYINPSQAKYFYAIDTHLNTYLK